ncbi:MAG: hypothetical protein L0Y56_18435 [Nitrospira sp.]|nr:hypothetical protein [Nitrospira sp.]
MQERILKIARLRPGEPFEEVQHLAITVDPTIEGFFLRLHSSLEEPSLAEYWFETLDLIDRQAKALFGNRFGSWQEPE